jgi:hypothetical protein
MGVFPGYHRHEGRVFRRKNPASNGFEHQVMGLSRNGVWFDMFNLFNCLIIKYSLGLSIWTWIPSGDQTYGKLSNRKSSTCRWFTLNKGFPIAKLHYHRGRSELYTTKNWQLNNQGAQFQNNAFCV